MNGLKGGDKRACGYIVPGSHGPSVLPAAGNNSEDREYSMLGQFLF